MQHDAPIKMPHELLAEVQAAWPALSQQEILTLALRALHALSPTPNGSAQVPELTDEELAKEIWKPLPDSPGCFVSNLGRIQGGVQKPTRLRKVSRQTGGYAVVKPGSANGPVQVLVSRTVAEHFIRKPKLGEVVNHKNGNKMDNRVSNLEWTFQKQSIRHSIDSGLRTRGSHRFSVLSSADRQEISSFRGKVKKGMLARIYGIRSSEVSAAFGQTGSPAHWRGCGRAVPLANSSAVGRP